MGTEKSELQKRFLSIRQRAESWGITADQLAGLTSVQSLRKDSGLCERLFWPFSLVAALAVLGLLCLLADFPPSSVRYAMVSQWVTFMGGEVDKEPCLVPVHESIVEIFRPPIDCSMCQNITKVDRVSQLSPEQFEAKYAYSGRPVVITDAMDDWTATSVFSFEFFKGIYSNDSPALINVQQQCQFFPYKTNFASLGEVFEMSEDRANMRDGSERWYIGWSNCDASATNTLRQHYQRPYFLPKLAESSRIDWLFMGSPGYGAHMHIDNVGNPSWQAQVTGSKLWTLEPPPECYYQCPSHVEATVNPGEIIVLDTNQWFHSTLIVSQGISITIGSEYD